MWWDDLPVRKQKSAVDVRIDRHGRGHQHKSMDAESKARRPSVEIPASDLGPNMKFGVLPDITLPVDQTGELHIMSSESVTMSISIQSKSLPDNAVTTGGRDNGSIPFALTSGTWDSESAETS